MCDSCEGLNKWTDVTKMPRSQMPTLKRALPTGVAFVIFLPLVAILRFARTGDNLEVQERRIVNFKAAMQDALKVDEKQQNEFSELINILPNLNLTVLLVHECSARDIQKRFRRAASDEINCKIKYLAHDGDAILSTVLETINTGVTTNETCHTCFELFHAARVALRHLTQRELRKMAGVACSTFFMDLLDSKVCRGLLDEYFDSVYLIGDLVFTARMSRNDICGLLFGPSCGPLSSEAHTWSVDLPKRLPLKRPLQHPSTGMHILHLSDFHYDPHYREGAIAQCEQPLCCRDFSEESAEQTRSGDTSVSGQMSDDEAEDWELANKTTALGVAPLAGRFGDLRHCDMPLETVESLINDAVNIPVKVSHIYLTGDIPPHDIWQSNKTEYYNITNTVYSLLADRLEVNVPVFPAVGNHEAVPPNLFTTTGNEVLGSRMVRTPELYENLAEFWKPWLGDEQLATVRHGGYYAKTVSPALKVISLNTNMCYYLNFWLLVDSRDPGGQLQWLVRELADSEVRGQRAHIIGHVPPSSFDCIHSWSEQFLRIVQRFNSTITGQFYGHTHLDEFTVFYAEDRVTPVGTAFVAPSATPYSAVNPAYKVFQYREDGLLHNAITRSFDLTKANKRGLINWQVEYDAVGAYKLGDLTPSSLDSLANKLQTEPDVFDMFYHRNSPDPRWTNITDLRRSRIAEATQRDVHHNGPARPLDKKTDLLDGHESAFSG
ncbi:sphingomyelin phosphodiesterase-like [Tropilaelaps mercedesae]|uniref:Sphingomyelin phosphodiesterase-like n=1 Tax=Tropilaelaps mercedesae TaxID=418985 RepID=A0A1V9XSV7_9ACAR|nr:sphingomyelin phosphodiesterase-like [Tropilaelaps mercedesae]